MGAFTHEYPGASVTRCYFHLSQSVLRKIDELDMKTDYESDDELHGCVRRLSALAHVPVVAESFHLLSEQMPEHEKMNELLSYFELTYIRGRRLQGRGNHYGSATFPIPIWNQYESAGDGIARATNIVEGWHHGIQSLFMFSHPSMWLLIEGWRKIARNRRQHSCKELLKSRKLASRNIVTWLAESDVLLPDTEERMCLYILGQMHICRTINTFSTIIIHN